MASTVPADSRPWSSARPAVPPAVPTRLCPPVHKSVVRARAAATFAFAPASVVALVMHRWAYSVGDVDGMGAAAVIATGTRLAAAHG